MSDTELDFYMWIISLFTDTFTGRLFLILFTALTLYRFVKVIYHYIHMAIARGSKYG